MENDMKTLPIAELEELAMDGNAAAVRELARRCADPGSDAYDPAMAQEWARRANDMDGEDPDTYDTDEITDPAEAAEVEDANEVNESHEPAEPAEPNEADEANAAAESYTPAAQYTETVTPAQLEKYEQWRENYCNHVYEGWYDSKLRAAAAEGNPYAATDRGFKFLRSSSVADMKQGIKILSDARDLTQELISRSHVPNMEQLLADINALMGQGYANLAGIDSPNAAAYAENARTCLENACELDSDKLELLPAFYRGAGQFLPEYRNNPTALQRKRMEVEQQLADQGGAAAQLNFALTCKEYGSVVMAQDYLLAVADADDIGSNPGLAAVAEAYRAQWSGRPADTDALRRAAEGGCSWACLLLADSLSDADEAMKYYQMGASIDPKTEGDASRAAACAKRLAQKQKEEAEAEAERQRQAAEAEAERQRKAATAEAERKRKEAAEAEAAARRQKAARDAQRHKQQNILLLAFGMVYVGTLLLCGALHVLGSAARMDIIADIGTWLTALWSLGTAGALAVSFLDKTPQVYRGDVRRYQITLVAAFVVTLLVWRAVA